MIGRDIDTPNAGTPKLEIKDLGAKPSNRPVEWFLPIAGLLIAIGLSYMVGHLVGLMQVRTPATHEQEVLAQQISAWSALVSAIASVLAFAAAAAGLIWIKGTLEATRTSAQIAQDAISATIRIGQAQVKAYLSLEYQRLGEWTSPIEIRIKGKVRNSGQTPARDVKCFSTWRFDRDHEPHKSIKFLGDLSANEDARDIYFDMSFNHFDVSGSSGALLEVVMTYKDVFGLNRQDEFSYEVAIDAREGYVFCVPYLQNSPS